MKATGIVRRIDDLGRVVVPKEIRRTLRIREGDPLEIFTDQEGKIVLKKYSPMKEIWEFAERFSQVLAKETGSIAMITDKDHVIAASGNGKKEYEKKGISWQLERAISNRLRCFSKKNEENYIPVIEYDPMLASEQIICTILSQGDAIGAVVLYGKEVGSLGPEDKKVAGTVADFLGGQFEII